MRRNVTEKNIFIFDLCKWWFILDSHGERQWIKLYGGKIVCITCLAFLLSISIHWLLSSSDQLNNSITELEFKIFFNSRAYTIKKKFISSLLSSDYSLGTYSAPIFLEYYNMQHSQNNNWDPFINFSVRDELVFLGMFQVSGHFGLQFSSFIIFFLKIPLNFIFKFSRNLYRYKIQIKKIR